MIKAGLAKKITITLIVVSVLSVLFSSIFMLLMTRQQFSAYINKYDQVMLNQWLPVISDYYAQHGTAGLQEYLESNVMGNGMGRGMGNGMGMHRGSLGIGMGMKMRQGQRLVVTDTNGIVLADTQQLLIGKKADFDTSNVSMGELTVGQRRVGNLYLFSPLGSGLSSLENDFVTKLTKNAGILALFIGLAALFTGLILGKRISSPVAELSSAIHEVAQGKLDKRMSLQGDNEFIELGKDFNLMAQSLEDAEKNRRRFTADLSHELRTPLTFLRGQLEAMQSSDTPINPEDITLLLDEVIRLSRLVKELDNLALVENHAVSLNIATFHIEELIERLAPVRFAIEDKGANFNINIGSGIKNISADQDRLLQILLNLLSNAMKHISESGSVELSIQKYKGYLQFAVADNGAGISSEDLPYVFERFYRVDASRNRSEGGMGLGLAIAKGYAEAHNGKMWVESTVGSGTTFYFTLAQDE